MIDKTEDIVQTKALFDIDCKSKMIAQISILEKELRKHVLPFGMSFIGWNIFFKETDPILHQKFLNNEKEINEIFNMPQFENRERLKELVEETFEIQKKALIKYAKNKYRTFYSVPDELFLKVSFTNQNTIKTELIKTETKNI